MSGRACPCLDGEFALSGLVCLCLDGEFACVWVGHLPNSRKGV